MIPKLYKEEGRESHQCLSPLLPPLLDCHLRAFLATQQVIREEHGVLLLFNCDEDERDDNVSEEKRR
jgi:hypothetical protein